MEYKYADRLVELRKKNGLSQDELAEKLNVSRQAVSNWERGESLPDTENLIALSKIYGVSIDELLGLNENDDARKSDRIEGDKDFVYISSDNGKDVVRINKNGIYINSNDEECGRRKRERRKTRNCEGFGDMKEHWLIRTIFGSVIFTLSVVAYVVIGCIYTQNNNIGWRIGWLLILCGFVLMSIVEMFLRKKVSAFALPIAATVVFIAIGMLTGIWHPTWVAFLSIPLFYGVVCPIEKRLKTKYEVIDDDDFDEVF